MSTATTQPTPRTLELVALVERLAAEHKRPPTFAELAAVMGVTISRIQAIVERAKECGLVSSEWHRPRTLRVIGHAKATRRPRAGRA